MRIISKFKDYYDSVQTYGQDKELIYLRNIKQYKYLPLMLDKVDPLVKKLLLVEKHLPPEREFKKNNYKWYLYHFVIGFCGTWYICIKAEKKYESYLDAQETKYFYSYNEMDSWVKKINIRELNEYFYDGKYKGPYTTLFYQSKKESIKKIFNSINQLDDKLFIELNTPIITVGYERIEGMNYQIVYTNSKLKKYGFAKVKDAFTCYQDISMYISGVLGSSPPKVLEVSNEIMRDKKGFNDWSFKTMPGTKKPRKKKKEL